MTPTNLLGALKTSLDAALPSWTVYDTPQTEVADYVLDMSLSGATAGQFTHGIDGMLEILYVRIARRALGFEDNRLAYLSLWDTRDPVTKAVFDAIESVAGVDLLPQTSTLPQWGEVYWTANDIDGADLFLACELTVPLDRKME